MHTPLRTINTLAQLQPHSRIFEFACNLSPDEGMIWASLIEKASNLLDVIHQQPQLWKVSLLCVLFLQNRTYYRKSTRWSSFAMA